MYCFNHCWYTSKLREMEGKMRRLLLIFSVFLGLFTSDFVCAASQIIEKQNKINLYKAPQLQAKVLENLSPEQQLVSIFYRDGWIKVGDPRNGNVGWVNNDQYRKAMRAYYQPNIQTVFVCTEHDGKAKPTINMVAYENGKKLSEKESQQLYECVKNRQTQEFRYMQRIFEYMDNLIEHQIREID